MRRARLVLLHLKTGQTVEGLMTKRMPNPHYILHMPRYRESENRTHPLDGHLEVHRDNVEFVQVIR